MPHSLHVDLRSAAVFLGEKGLSLWKYRMMTAMMAPIWITTKNKPKKASETSSFKNSSTRIICPVLEMGSHSVMPSTRPMINALNASKSMHPPYFNSDYSAADGPNRRRTSAGAGLPPAGLCATCRGFTAVLQTPSTPPRTALERCNMGAPDIK